MKHVVLLLVVLVFLVATPATVYAGKAEIEEFERVYGIETDPAMNERVTRVTANLNEAANKMYECKKTVVSKVLKLRDIQAFAIRDGKRAYISIGLMTALKDRPDDEVAAVLTHEFVHIYKDPPKKRWVEVIGGMIVGGILGGEIAEDKGIEYGSQFGGAVVQSRHEKDDEYLSDAEGVKLLYEAGYDPYALARAMLLLKADGGNGPAKKPIIGWLVSHPDTGRRVDGVIKTAQKYVPSIPEDLQNIKEPTIPDFKSFWTAEIWVPWWKDQPLETTQPIALFSGEVHEHRTIVFTTKSGQKFAGEIHDVSRKTHKIWVMAEPKMDRNTVLDIREGEILPKEPK